MSQTERFVSQEMGDLMNQVQELLEVRVMAMIVEHPNGGLSLACPPANRAEVARLLRTYDWSTLE